MINDLARFLRARLDEEAALAQAASPGPWHVNAESDEVLAVDGVAVADGFALSGKQLRATTAHVARHDPPSVLFDLDIKRMILKLHRDSHRCPAYDQYAGGRQFVDIEPRVRVEPCSTLRALALPYTDHPDYRDEWRP